MSKNVDLIAVGVLLLVFAFAAHVSEAAHVSLLHARVFRLRPFTPVVIVPPHVPAVPHLLHLPRV